MKYRVAQISARALALPVLRAVLAHALALELVELVEQHALDALDPGALDVGAGGRQRVHLGAALAPHLELARVALHGLRQADL